MFVMRFQRLLAVLALAGLAACASKGSRAADAEAAPVQPGPPPTAVYDDAGPADPATPMRALLSFAARDVEALDAIDDPASPSFHEFLTRDAWLAAHAPLETDFNDVKAWIVDQGFATPHVASNRLLIELSGTVEEFQAVFATEIHVFDRKKQGSSNALQHLLGAVKPVVLPDALQGKTRGVLMIAPAAASTPLPVETETAESQPENALSAFVPSQLAKHYGLDALGTKGEGETIAVVVGSDFKRHDVRAFWKAFDITRADPEVVVVGEGPSVRSSEASTDIEWSGALAPSARLIAYQGADVHDLSLVIAFNEAIGDGKATVVTDSFSHRERNVSKAVAEQYELSAKMAAALGMTVVASTGDSKGVDVPATCPHVTAVGGTRLAISDGTETVWSDTGAGLSSYFDRPAWQSVSPNARRGIPDVALAADPSSPYWILHLGRWDSGGGTSFSSPVFAAIIASVNAQRTAAGKPRAGFLNPVLYGTPAVRASFRDVVTGNADAKPATVGWDAASGWGSPQADQLATSLP